MGARARITVDHVEILTNAVEDGERLISAAVRGINRRLYYVDRNPSWGDDWLCTCGYAPTCGHIRAVKEAIA